jgi:RimJ/RimL family protein N-acetyltransferase
MFDHVDAGHITSGAFTDNPASLAVSRKTGYVEHGWRRVQRLGKPATVQGLLLEPAKLVRYDRELEVDGLAAFRRSIGLDADQLAA